MSAMGGFLLLAVACGGTEEDAGVAAEALTVKSTPTTRVIPQSPVQLGTNPHDNFGQFFAAYIQSGGIPGYTLGFMNVDNVPIYVCGAYTCGGSKTGFDLSVPIVSSTSNGLVSVPIKRAGNLCKKGEQFQYAYSVSKNPISLTTCRTTRDRI